MSAVVTLVAASVGVFAGYFASRRQSEAAIVASRQTAEAAQVAAREQIRASTIVARPGNDGLMSCDLNCLS
jgi:hypothetical protein